MKRIDNIMISSLFTTAQFLNKFNTSPSIRPDVKVNLQSPLALYHQRKDDFREIIVNNTSDEAITQPLELAFVGAKLKKIKVSASHVNDQPSVIDELGALNTFLAEMIQKHSTTTDTPDIVVNNGENIGGASTDNDGQ
jgi:hypothetical protein